MPETPAGIQIFQYNAFTDRPFAGNPAGVVLDAGALDDETMARIARQMNLAETAFLAPPSSPDADVRLRWFTPALEVDLCGHATIAAFTAAAEHGLFRVDEGDERTLAVETRSGLLRIRIARRGNRPWVAMQIPLPRFEPLEVDRDVFAALWGVSARDLDGEWIAHRTLNYWFLPVRDLATLRRLTLNVEALARVEPAAAFAFLTDDTVDPDSDWHLRFFAPFHGVPEDVVTGSAQGPAGVLHLHRSGKAGSELADGWFEFRGEQGDHLGRPGRVTVRVRYDAGAVTDLEIAGVAVAMLEGQIRT
jgi:PhzF family phenazine biosynthesis protein